MTCLFFMDDVFYLNFFLDLSEQNIDFSDDTISISITFNHRFDIRFVFCSNSSYYYIITTKEIFHDADVFKYDLLCSVLN